MQAHTIKSGTGNRRFSPVTLTMSATKLVESSSFPISWFLHVDPTWPLCHCPGWFLHVLGHCPGHCSSVSFAYFTLPPGRACEANDQRSAQRSVRSVGIGQISWRFEIDRPKGLKEAGLCLSVRKLLFPFASARARAKCGRNGPSMHTHGGIRVRQTPKVLRPAARLDGLAKLSSRSNGLEGQTEPELKRCGPTRVRDRCINASVTCDPRQNKKISGKVQV